MTDWFIERRRQMNGDGLGYCIRCLQRLPTKTQTP